MRFCTSTLGCKVNQYETQAIEDTLISRGHERAETGEACDVCIVNTCAITNESVRKSRQAIRRMKKSMPDTLIAVCGCLSQLDPETAVTLGADLIGGSGGRYDFALEIENCFNEAMVNQTPTMSGFPNDSADELIGVEGQRAFSCNDIKGAKIVLDDPVQRFIFEDMQARALSGRDPGRFPAAAKRTRALLKIQDGCDNHCSYCVIPLARGPVRSLPAERVIQHARRIGEQGFREIVITGIEISSYGKDLADKPSLTDAIRSVSSAAPGARLRLGSLDPAAVTWDFCRELSYIRGLCDHFHLSLQSGCDDTLRRMGRKYDTNAAAAAAAMLRSRFPGCGLTADLITGFPGETDAEFEHTLAFIKSVFFSDMHIFPFSPRPGTHAAVMPGQIEKNVRRERARLAGDAAGTMAYEFRTGMIGKTTDVLFERERGGYWTGHSGSYVEITAKNGGSKNNVHAVRITGVEDDLVWGEL